MHYIGDVLIYSNILLEIVWKKCKITLPLSSALLRGRRNDSVTSLALSLTRSLVSFDEITGAETGLGVASVDESAKKKKYYMNSYAHWNRRIFLKNKLWIRFQGNINAINIQLWTEFWGNIFCFTRILDTKIWSTRL